MMVLGVVVKAGAKPVLNGAVLTGTTDDPSLVEVFDLRASDADLVEQIAYLAGSLASKISGLDLDAVVIRLADFPPRASRKLASDRRLMIEGALALAAQSLVSTVRARTGKEIGACRNSSKAAVDNEAKNVDLRRFEAVAAAMTEL